MPPAHAIHSGEAVLHTGGDDVDTTIDPARTTPEERLAEVAGILARGILRLHTRNALPAEKLSDSGQNKLDSRPQTIPDVSVVNAEPLSEKGDT